MLLFHFTIDFFQEAGDWVLFFGRFHPALLHLPIGILVFGLVMELGGRLFKWTRPATFMSVLWGIGAITGALAAIAGLLLSADAAGYEPDTLWLHKRLGLATALLAGLAYAGVNGSSFLRRFYPVVLGLLFIALGYGGHLGGTLTHGNDYLTQYMPNSLRALIGLPPKGEGIGLLAGVEDVGQAQLYGDLVQPILETKCYSCHSDQKREGGLRLDTPDFIMEGGENGEVVIPGKARFSEMMRRSWLPMDLEEHMPPHGKPQLSAAEAELMRWWIDQGASFEQTLEEAEATPVIELIFEGLDLPEKKEGIFRLDVPMPDSVAVAQIQQAGLPLAYLSMDSPFLQLDAAQADTIIVDPFLEQLAPVSEQLTWLNLKATAVTDAGLSTLAQFPNLSRLDLSQTAITDAGLRHLSGLTHLESLNLYGTVVTDAGLHHLKGLPNLKHIFLWQTSVTEEGVLQLKTARPDLDVNLGARFEPVLSE